MYVLMVSWWSDDVEGGLVDYWLRGSIHDLIDIATMYVLPVSWWSDDVEGGLVDYWLCGSIHDLIGIF